MDMIHGHPGTAHAVEESRLGVGVGRVQLAPQWTPSAVVVEEPIESRAHLVEVAVLRVAARESDAAGCLPCDDTAASV